jgi:hypothetical protein
MKSRLKPRNACYHSVQNLSSSRRGAYRVLVGRPDGKRPLGRLGRRSEDNIKIEIQEVE